MVTSRRWMAALCLLFCLISIRAVFEPSLFKIPSTGKEFIQQQNNLVLGTLDELNFALALKDQGRIKSSFIDLRKAYKAIEPWIIAHFYEEAIRKINGAPLPKLEPNAPSVVVLDPEGIQAIEEILCEETWDWKRLNELVNNVDYHLRDVISRSAELRENDETILLAVKLGLLQTYLLGLTGFDAPCLADPIVEAEITLNGMMKLMGSISGYREVKHILMEALQYVRDHSNFETFDRLVFYKEFWKPCYQSFKVESKLVEKSPVNFNVELFDKNFLDPNHFTGLKDDEKSQLKKDLGRDLFYDPIMSKDGRKSCASCHDPNLAFTDGQMKSMAIDTGTVDRNAMSLNYSVYATQYFSDMRADRISDVVQHVIFHPKEFSMDLGRVRQVLSKEESYLEKFAEVYNTEQIQLYQIPDALEAFVASLPSFDSPFDRYMRDDIEALPDNVSRGFNLFMGKANCATCHFPPTFSGLLPPYFTDSESEVLGVPGDKTFTYLDRDLGRMASQRLEVESIIYSHAFKTTTVRNASMTAPYMHNGVFSDLQEVMEFYNHGGGQGHDLVVPNQTLPQDSLGLNQNEISDIIAFLESLTDQKYLNSERSN